jgi:hypothetical protein
VVENRENTVFDGVRVLSGVTGSSFLTEHRQCNCWQIAAQQICLTSSEVEQQHASVVQPLPDCTEETTPPKMVAATRIQEIRDCVLVLNTAAPVLKE